MKYGFTPLIAFKNQNHTKLKLRIPQIEVKTKTRLKVVANEQVGKTECVLLLPGS